jgi:hypothetical protein
LKQRRKVLLAVSLTVVLVLAMVFILFSDVRETSMQALAVAVLGILSALGAYLASLTLLEVALWGVSIAAGVGAALAIRQVFRRSTRFLASECPRCGSELRRIHRTPLDKLMTRLLLPHSHRYKCSNTDCGWSGLRRSRMRKRRRTDETDLESIRSVE